MAQSLCLSQQIWSHFTLKEVAHSMITDVSTLFTSLDHCTCRLFVNASALFDSSAINGNSMVVIICCLFTPVVIRHVTA